MVTICVACGMPMEKAEDHALGDLAKPYCRHCTTANGNMQSYPEKLANFTNWLISTQGLDQTVAKDQAAIILSQLPAWQNQSG